MSHKKMQFQLQPTPRTGLRIVIVVAALMIGLGAIAVWRGPEAGPVKSAWALAGGDSLTMTVYKGPECDCCGMWIALMRDRGVKMTVIEQADVSPTKTRLGVPVAAKSCHTATIGGYVVEGHVPFEDIVRIVTQRPPVVGIAVPGMPTGTPGMDGPKVPYDVMSFDKNGALATFARR